jgi:hypothetical protein
MLLSNLVYGPTLRAQNTAVKQYISMVQATGRGLNDNGDVFPVTLAGALEFGAFMYEKGLQPETIDQYFSHLRTFCLTHGYPTTALDSDLLKRARKAIKRLLKESGRLRPRRDRIGITLGTAVAFRRHLNITTLPDLRTWLICLVAITTMCRTGELLPSRLTPYNPHLLPARKHWTDCGDHSTLKLPATKTDREGQGVTVIIPCIPGPEGDHRSCPHCLMKYAWMPHTAGNDDDSLWALAGTVYTKEEFVATLKSLAAKEGLPRDQVGGHSLRIGGATGAKDAGLTDDEIMILGRWTSEMYQRYLRYPPSERHALLNRVAHHALKLRASAINSNAPWAERAAQP